MRVCGRLSGGSNGNRRISFNWLFLNPDGGKQRNGDFVPKVGPHHRLYIASMSKIASAKAPSITSKVFWL
jgi:hypothetical protein